MMDNRQVAEGLDEQQQARVDKALNRIEAVNKAHEKFLDLKGLGITSKELSVLLPAIQEIQNLEVLDLGNNKLTTLPREIALIFSLKELMLDDNQLKEIPDSFWALGKLKMLDLSGNRFTFFPESITELPLLEELYLSHNLLSQIPNSIRDLERLKLFDMSNNELTAIPAGLARLRQLQALYLKNNSLSNITRGIGNLKELQILDLSNNPPLRNLPSTMTYLSQKLDIYVDLDQLSADAFNSAAFHFNNFGACGTGWIREQVLSKLPEPRGSRIHTALDKIAEARDTNATQLDLSDRQLKSEDLRLLMPYIQQIANLETLDLNENNLDTLPDNMADLLHLKKLCLGYNSFSEMPECIDHMFQLEELDLSFNGFTAIPDGFGAYLGALQKLSLNGNRLEQISEDIGALKSLKILNLGENQISKLSARIGDLSKLKILDLGDNKLGEIPDCFEGLQQLEKLGLEGNAIPALPDSCGTLKNLKVLNLANNDSLRSLPASITNLSKALEFLIELEKLPASLSRMLKGHFDILRRNPSEIDVDWREPSGPHDLPAFTKVSLDLRERSGALASAARRNNWNQGTPVGPKGSKGSKDREEPKNRVRPSMG